MRGAARWMASAALLATAGCTAAAPTAAPASAGVASAPAPARPTGAPTAGVLAVLASLRVAGRAPLTGYSRAAFGAAWTDDNGAALGHNGCDTRNDVLRRDLRAVVVKPDTRGCVVLRGSLTSPYTGAVIAFVRGRRTSAQVQIDHVVALGDAWQTGAQRWPAAERVTFANDPLELLAVDARSNEAKGDADAASWLPADKAFRCAYVTRQVRVKARYRLSVTPAERDAMQRVLSRCPAA